MGTKGIVVVLAVVLSASIARAEDSPEDKKLAIEAAKALYGEGLTIKRAAGTITIEPKAGGLTQEKYNQYVEKFYLPAVVSVPWDRQGAAFHYGPEEYRYPAKFEPTPKGRLAFVLLEPTLKAHICVTLMNRGGDTPTFAAKRDNRDWCVWQGMVESTRPIFEYRGEKVTWDDKRERGDIAIDAPLWEKDANNNYPMIVTVAGARDVITKMSIGSLRWLAMEIDGDGQNGPKAKAHSAKIFAAYEKLEKAVAAKQKKLLGKARVAIAGQMFTEWEATAPKPTGIACEKAAFIAYTPAGETFFIAMKVDGTTCAYYTTSGNSIERDTPRYFEHCWDRLAKSGTHKLDFEIQEMIKGGGSYSRLEIRQNKIKDVKYDVIDSGKKLFGASGSCETK